MMSTKRTRISASIFMTLGLVLPQGCQTTTPRGTTPSARSSLPRAALGQPLRLTLTVDVARGRVDGRRGDGRWRQLPSDRGVTGLTALRSVGRGALLTLSGTGRAAAGKLWLRGGTELCLGQTGDGTLRLLLVKGEARLSLFDLGRRVVLLQRLQGGERRGRTIAGQDLLVRASGDAGDTVVPTAMAPRAADWALAMTEAEAGTSGVGSLSVGAGSGRVSLELRQVRVQAFTSGDLAETRVEHVFFNDAEQQLEGTFRFPLPEGAALIGLAMEIDGRMMEGELVERQKARQTYESIVDAMEDPALLEWEQGNTFKLRVFPVEARREKRVVLRYVAPLERTGEGLSYRYDTAAAEMQRQIPRFSLTLDGRSVVDARGFVPGRSVTVAVADTSAGKARREVRGDGIYTALRLRPDWTRLPRPAARWTPRDLLLLVDTSRSALESRELCLQTLRALLADLRPGDRFLLLAADLTVRAHAGGFTAAGASEIRRAIEFVAGIEPDGASDLGLALRTAGERLAAPGDREERRAQVVYLGDGTATWGETEASALERLAVESLGETPLHAVILGKGADARVLRRLAAIQGGRAVQPHTRRDVQHLVLQLGGAATMPRLRQLRIRAGEHEQLFPQQAPTLFYGEELTVLMRTPTDQTPAPEVVLEGLAGDRPFVQTFAATRVAPARHVAHRWAQRRLEQLELEDAPKEALVKHSLQYGVMSRHTAFLVLESEEAYRRFQIARRNAPQPDPARVPSVTGGDLESLGRARANLSPDHFQPGDPEVRIPAPADARSVVVVFPFGETKVAGYEPALKAWTVRFLVAQDTPDGTYQITVRITHRDGRVELLRLSYVVDTRAPTVKIDVRRVRGESAYVISASQIVTRHELVQEAGRDQIAGNPVALDDMDGLQRYAAVVQDAARVEVQLPEGRVLRLWPYGGGRFAATWRPRTPLTGSVTLRVVAVDTASNKSVFSLTFDPATGKVSR